MSKKQKKAGACNKKIPSVGTETLQGDGRRKSGKIILRSMGNERKFYEGGLGIPLDSFYMEEIHKGAGRVCQNLNDKNYCYMLYHLENMPFSLAVCSEDCMLAEEPVFAEL